MFKVSVLRVATNGALIEDEYGFSDKNSAVAFIVASVSALGVARVTFLSVPVTTWAEVKDNA